MGRGFALQGLGVAAHATALRIKPPLLIAISDNRDEIGEKKSPNAVEKSLRVGPVRPPVW
jgi:hypothetical protein